MNGWSVFNNTAATTTNNLIYTGTDTNWTYVPNTVWGGSPSVLTGVAGPVEGSARRRDPLDWLRSEVDRIVDLGRLDD